MKIPGIGVMRGLKVVLSEMVQTYTRGAFTVQYPEERQEIPARYRGRHVWLYDVDSKTGEKKPRCVACLACARSCPQGIIKLETARGTKGERVVKRFEIDMGLCMYCGLCVEACNFHALRMSQVFEQTTYERPSLVWGVDKLLTPAQEYEHAAGPAPENPAKEAAS